MVHRFLNYFFDNLDLALVELFCEVSSATCNPDDSYSRVNSLNCNLHGS